MSATVSASQVAELAAMRSSPGTIRGMTASRAGRKKIETDVTMKTTGKTSNVLVNAASGSRKTIPARNRSLRTRTRFWFVRSTNVPASEPKTRLGTVAAKNTKLVAISDLVCE